MLVQTHSQLSLTRAVWENVRECTKWIIRKQLNRTGLNAKQKSKDERNWNHHDANYSKAIFDEIKKIYNPGGILLVYFFADLSIVFF